MTFTLSGETEIVNVQDYSVGLHIPTSFEFIGQMIDLRCSAIERRENAADLTVHVRFAPKRPFQLVTPLKVRNPLGQEWQFEVDIKVDRGRPLGTIVVESLLNKSGTGKVMIPASFSQQTPFHAYFVQGSAAEFSVDREHGYIEPSVADSTELPALVVFEPKMYGKFLKGMLVVDTLEAQYLFDVVGKTPEYVPPVVTGDATRIGLRLPGEDEQSVVPAVTKRKRNIIRDNIENAKLGRSHLPPVKADTSHI
jgi:hypothetical protein